MRILRTSNLKQKIISRRRKKLHRDIFLILILLAILWIPGYFLYQYTFGAVDSRIGEGLWGFKNSLFSLREKLAGPETIEQLKREKEELLKENAGLKEQLMENSIKLENDPLSSSHNLLEVKITGRDNFLDTPIIFLGKGSGSGIRQGMAAVDERGSLLGLVKESQDKISIVRLITHPQSRTNGLVAGTDWNGVLEGKRNARAVLKMLPLESEPRPGNPVVTDNSNPDIPAGLLLGDITEVRESDDHLFKEAFIELPWDVEKLRKAWIVMSSK